MLRLDTLTACLVLLLTAGQTLAQTRPTIPDFWDPRIRIDRPEPGPPRVVRFLTDDEYPPLHFPSADGSLTGFSVELARAVCEKMTWSCTIQARRFDTLLDTLAEGRGDVLAAAINLTPPIRTRFAASHLYFRGTARFVTTRGNASVDLDTASLRGKRVAVVSGTAHQAYLDQLLPFVQRREAANPAAALAALRSGDAEYVFGDGVALSLQLAGTAGRDLAFSGGPFLESRYFGEGVAFLLRKATRPSSAASTTRCRRSATTGLMRGCSCASSRSAPSEDQPAVANACFATAAIQPDAAGRIASLKS